MNGLEKLVIESFVFILPGLYGDSELLLEMGILTAHECLYLGRLLDCFSSESQLLPVVAAIFPSGCHFLILLVGPVVLQKRTHGQFRNV